MVDNGYTGTESEASNSIKSTLLVTSPVKELMMEQALVLASKSKNAKKNPTRANVPAAMEAYLQAQLELAGVQIEDFREERHLAMVSARTRRWTDILRLGVLACTVASIGIAATVLGIVVWKATQDQGMVIEAFSVPPDMADRGLTGAVVAGKLQDKLASLDAQTRSIRPKRSYAGNWGGNIKVQIPGTGISIGELIKSLHNELGNITRINGDVYRTSGKLKLTARTDASSIEVDGVEADLDRMMDRIAEGVYERTQPFRHAIWLVDHGQKPKGVLKLMELAAREDPEEKFWATFGLSHNAEHAEDARAYAVQATQLKPHMSNGWTNLAIANQMLGHQEEALQAWREGLRMKSSTVDAGVTSAAAIYLSDSAEMNISFLLGDYEAARIAGRKISDARFYPMSEGAGRIMAELALVRSHGTLTSSFSIDAATIKYGLFFGQAIPPHVEFAAMQGDWAMVAATLETMRQLGDLHWQDGVTRQSNMLLAEAYAHLGRWREADKLLITLPDEMYDAVRTRGRIATLKKDWAGAARLFAIAIQNNPSLPHAYKDWGDMLVIKGDTDLALEKFQIAHQKGPRWADPLKAWGDVLHKRGAIDEARLKYAEALERAPQWTALRELQVSSVNDLRSTVQP